MKTNYVLVGRPGERRLKKKVNDGLVSDNTCDEINEMLEHKVVNEESVNEWLSDVPLISGLESYFVDKSELTQDTKNQH